MRRIAVITGTRADWGLLSPIAGQLGRCGLAEPLVVATNMHLLERYGNTIDEIKADGFTPAALVHMDPADDSPAARVKAMARCLDGMADALQQLKPDLALILGDRYEMLAAASAALMLGIPIAHIAGGEISEGAVDDSIRHAITKMASLHLTATEPYRRRVIQMGEHPSRVINTGAIGVWNALNVEPMSLEQLRASIGFDIDSSTLLVTYHPATLDTGASPARRFDELLKALDSFSAHKVIFTYPNNDAHGAAIIQAIERYASLHPGRVLAIASLGRVRYLSALRHVAAVVGNSSSGIVEVPSMHIPTVDIGIRQQGRIASESVIHCGDSASQIAQALSLALSPQGRLTASRAANPYYRPDTLDSIVSALAHYPLEGLRAKHFHDIDLTACS